MRKLLLCLTVLAGAAAIGTGAAQAAVYPGPIAVEPAQVQTVQYYHGYGGWRAHDYWRHRRHVEWHRHHGWNHYRGRYGY